MTTQEINTNIKRLENTISQNYWNKGYIENCKSQIESYKKSLVIWMLNFNGKDRKEINFIEFEKLINTIGMNWHGLENWTGSDLMLFELKFDGVTCEPVNNGMMLWDRNYDYSGLYQNKSSLK